MTTTRLVQNFRQNHGILWAPLDFDSLTLERTLAKLGVALTRVDDIGQVKLDQSRDIVFIDGDQPFDPAWLTAIGKALPATPMIGIVGVEAPSRLKLFAELGVTAFLRKPIHAATVYSALFLGVNNHRRMRAMEERLAELDRRRHGRRFVIKAVVAMVQHDGLTDDEAFALLRRESMRQRVGLEDFCAAFLARDEGSLSSRLSGSIRNTLSHHIGDGTYATHSDARRGDHDADGPDRCQSGAPYQDRRA